MGELEKARATICVVNYKTLDLTRLCLRSIRKFTEYPCDVIVVDNDSKDESTEYLRSLKWIRLIERPYKPGDPRGSFDEGSALDLALANCNTEFYVIMHSDTIVQRRGWLGELIEHFNDDHRIVCVGSGKIELTPGWQRFLKKATDLKALQRKLLGSAQQKVRFRYHNRTICCLYRTDMLKKENLSFLIGLERKLTSGQGLYFELRDRGYNTVELKSAVMSRYITHLTHATQVINPQEFRIADKDKRRYNRIIDKVLSSNIIQEVIRDDSLDK